MLYEVESGKYAPEITLSFGERPQLEYSRGKRAQIQEKQFIRRDDVVNFIIKNIYTYRKKIYILESGRKLPSI